MPTNPSFHFNSLKLNENKNAQDETGASTKKRKLESGGVLGFDGKTHEYTNYNQTSKNYDNTRSPLGLNIFLGSFSLGEVPLESQHLLDIGCGTGSFLEVIKGKFGSVTGLEYNDGMLLQCRARLGQDVPIVQGSADNLPFEDSTFHAITFNQVIHHFPKDGDYDFLARTLKECSRVLKPGGRIVINTSAPEQQRDGFWWVALFEKSVGPLCERFPPIDVVVKHLGAGGFEVDADSVCVPLTRSLMAPEKYLPANGIACAFDKSYQDGDSSWAMAENFGELEEALAKIKEMTANGLDRGFLETREKLRKSVGQATFVTAVKL